MTTPLLPNAELITRAYLLAAVAGLDNNVSTALPDPPWPNDEFVQIMRVGGSPNIDLPQFKPVMSINCFALKRNSQKPPWGKANELASRIVMSTYQHRWSPDGAVELELPAGYGRAIVQSVWPVSEINRLPSDPSQYAVYTVDLQLVWIPASVVIEG